ncbi:MAG TPA: ribokinase [Flavitalea sp.]|nr:ribokinase [Flavitalea sp.]
MDFILVVGSSNTDMVIQTDHLPAAGETIIGGNFFMNPGGKGANQAVAAARLGARVKFVTKTGKDIFGQQARDHFQSEGIDITGSVIDHSHPSGVALITVDQYGENTILVASGANAQLFPTDIRYDSLMTNECKAVLLQLEIPLATVVDVIKEGSQRKIPVILNPAPAAKLPDEVLQNVTILTPNEIEASMLTGIDVTDLDSAKLAGSWLLQKGIGTIVITLGSKGALVCSKHGYLHVAAPEVQAVDTTAAGDVFSGALASCISRAFTIEDAVEFACRAASVSVTRLGAQQAVPYLHEL